MDRESEIYGTQAKVFIQYKGTLQELGLKIEAGLNVPELQYEYVEDEPYDLFGSAEILGFEIELQKMRDDKWPDYQYCLTAMTTDSFEEIMDNPTKNRDPTLTHRRSSRQSAPGGMTRQAVFSRLPPLTHARTCAPAPLWRLGQCSRGL